MTLNDKQIQILEVAEKLFAEHGFDGTSVRQISLEADINIAMISYYFGSKEKLLEALFNFRMEDFRMELESLISKKEGYLKTLNDIIALMLKRVHRNRLTHKILNFEFSNESRDIDFENYVNQKRENYQLFETFIKEGQSIGVFVKNVNVKLIVPTIIGTYFHWYYNQRFFKTFFELGDEPESMDNFVSHTLTKHIQQTINALLTNAN
ncbi:MAG: TetR family transcriptional regulator [Gelidibacter sp.]